MRNMTNEPDETDANVQHLGFFYWNGFIHLVSVSMCVSDQWSSNRVVDKYIPSNLKYHMAWSQLHYPKKVVGGMIQSLEIS